MGADGYGIATAAAVGTIVKGSKTWTAVKKLMHAAGTNYAHAMFVSDKEKRRYISVFVYDVYARIRELQCLWWVRTASTGITMRP
jgi:hypothetical protein